jgi:hypothetical protein
MRYEVFTVLNMKVTIFWDVTLCRLKDRYRHFVGICSSSALKIESKDFSEVSTTFLLPDYTAVYPRRNLASM